MEARVQELEKQVAQLLEERDDLYRDIEKLCVAQDDGSCWSTSAVLMQRAIDAERHNATLTAEKAKLQAEKAKLLEDMASLRESNVHPNACHRERQDESNQPKETHRTANRRHSCASCENLKPSDMADDAQDVILNFSDLQSLYRKEIESKDAQLREMTSRAHQLEEELASLVNVPDVSAQLKSATQENELLQKRIKLLEVRHKRRGGSVVWTYGVGKTGEDK